MMTATKERRLRNQKLREIVALKVEEAHRIRHNRTLC